MKDYHSMNADQMSAELREMAELAPTPDLQECYQRAAALLGGAQQPSQPRGCDPCSYPDCGCSKSPTPAQQPSIGKRELARLLTISNVMHSAYRNGGNRLMSVWEQDLEAIDAAVAALSSDGGVESRHAPNFRPGGTAGDGLPDARVVKSDSAVSVAGGLVTQAGVAPGPSDLLPCPFCGGSPQVVEIEPHSHAGGIADFMPDHPGSAYIDCACGVGCIDATKEAVTARWNKRDASPIPEGQCVSELASAAIELAKLPDDVYWLLAKGRTRPDEPLWAIQITDRDANKLVEKESDDPAHCIRMAAAALPAAGGK